MSKNSVSNAYVLCPLPQFCQILPHGDLIESIGLILCQVLAHECSPVLKSFIETGKNI